ncbi:unnamed protein product [Paramecium octaurelia]|uniref:Insertion element IS150 protein InsJ-like helix-turn-helix domain-containing protein n=1 Tax=Paramecium octaurelia TaxID=43137 RepID=A0A8S1TBX4_PAROT|nr:unnamed protein product [Paramecium octaurelia]
MKYAKISDATRKAFIDKVKQGVCTIKQAAKQFGIKFSTGKAILSLYKHEGRVGKKERRTRRLKKHSEEKENQTQKCLKDEPPVEAKQVQVQEVSNCQNNQSYFNQYSSQYYNYNYQQWYQTQAWLQYMNGLSSMNCYNYRNIY